MQSLLYERIKLLCSENHITIAELERELGFSNSTIRKWGKNISPSINKVIKVADFFNVSLDYLSGVTDIRDSIGDVITDADIISFQRARQKMSDSDNKRMMKMLKVAFDYAFDDDSEGQ